MAFHINISPRDILELENINIPNAQIEKIDFSNVVVKKPWGYEYLLYENENVSVWCLYIKNKELTSMHCHRNKKTALLVLSGIARCVTFAGEFLLNSGEGVVLEKKVFHSTTACSANGTLLIEVETPPQKTDVVRLTDKYGRELKGYERQEAMDREIQKYQYASFSNNEKPSTKIIGNIEVSLIEVNSRQDLLTAIPKGKKNSMILLKGKIRAKGTPNIFLPGDVISLQAFPPVNLDIHENISALITAHPPAVH